MQNEQNEQSEVKRPTDAEASYGEAMLKAFQKWDPRRLYTGAPADPVKRRHFDKTLAKRRAKNKVARKSRKVNAR
ncbi:hypothetical protein K8O93_00875 [Gordonia bronchialis]|uniref:hypothetical protein n=1 Tax=Gordonia bronchialis TaxID=2054 RepID=UPI001CC13D0C|nr:hypothetical protein [Gordonia bronchialis]UAK38386.1 hypothetical protein K8O93_00875 [Gordonia bronchialis]